MIWMKLELMSNTIKSKWREIFQNKFGFFFLLLVVSLQKKFHFLRIVFDFHLNQPISKNYHQAIHAKYLMQNLPSEYNRFLSFSRYSRKLKKKNHLVGGQPLLRCLKVIFSLSITKLVLKVANIRILCLVIKFVVQILSKKKPNWLFYLTHYF